MVSRFAWLLPLGLIACTDKGVGPGDSGSTGGDDSQPDSDSEEVPVWTEVRVETSTTLTGLFASGQGLYVVGQGGYAWLRREGAWTALTGESEDNGADSGGSDSGGTPDREELLDTDGEDLNDLWGTGKDASLELVAVGNVGIIASYNSDGWLVEDIGTANLEAVDGATTSDLFAVGWGGIFSNATGAWTYQEAATGRRLNDVWYDGSTGMAVGEDGDYAIYTGTDWVDDALPGRENLYAVDGVDASDVWAVGEDGNIFRWNGSEWTAFESPTSYSLWDIWVASSSEVYVVGNNGSAFVWDGSAWTALPTGVDNNLYAVGGAGNGAVWACGNRGMVVSYQAGI